MNNDGKGAGTHEVRLKIDGAVTKTEVVALGAGTQKEVLFTVSEGTVGTYNVEIEDLTATFSIRPALFLEITSPVNQSVVSSSSVEIEGNTLSTAILSINGSLTAVTSSGTFTSALVLEEGVNVIQVVVSDLRGNEIGEILSLIYLP